MDGATPTTRNHVAGLIRLTELQTRVCELEAIVASLARYLDPTSSEIDREDRKTIVRHAAKTRLVEPPRQP